MNKYLKYLAVFSMMSSSLSAFADVDKVDAALKKGDMKTVYSETLIEANNDNLDAIYNIGVMLRDGQGTEVNIKEALKYFEKGSAKGDIQAKFNAAKIYDLGAKDVQKNLVKAFELYSEAADKGLIIAMRSIASMYSVGDGVEKDLKKAISWYFKAAGSGDHESQYMIGNAYSTGDGLNKNYEEAAYWYREAANRGNLLALYNLGTIYAKGKGVEKNYVSALKWLKLAEIGGFKKAKNNIAAVTKSLKAVEVKEAETKAAQWLLKFRS